MKNIITSILVIILLLKTGSAQIPNADFENWEENNPANWFTSNLPGIFAPVSKSTDAHSGLYAVQGNVLSSITGSGYPPSLVAGIYGVGFPINFRPNVLHGWFKFFPDCGDVLCISVALTKDARLVGNGNFFASELVPDFSEFNVNITYCYDEIPDTAMILIITTDSSSIHIGTKFIIDDLSMPDFTNVRETVSNNSFSFNLEQNYPNPFNPNTKISWQSPVGNWQSLKVYDVLGNEVATLVNEEKSAGSYEVSFNASQLSSGIYFYRLKAGGFNEVKKMLLVK